MSVRDWGKGWFFLLSATWSSISANLNARLGVSAFANTKITDMVFPDPNKVFVAISDVNGHFYIWEGVRPENGSNWIWGENAKLDLDGRDIVETRFVNRLCLIPGTTKLLIGTKRKGNSGGGLYCVNYEDPDWASGMTCWLAGWNGEWPDPSTAEELLGNNVTSIAADASGEYVYAGCSGPDRPLEIGRGGLVRFKKQLDGNWDFDRILAGDGPVGADTGDVFGIRGVVNYDFPDVIARDWEFCTRVNDIEIDPDNPLVAYVAVGPGNWTFYGAQFGAWRVTDSAWDQIWGARETGSGAKTVGISPVDHTKLYVGSVGQEFFEVPITPASHPAIDDTAVYPLLANTLDDAHVFAVHVTSPTAIQQVTADLTGLELPGIVLTLLDDGGGSDVAAGDGIYTSGTFATTLVTTNSYKVRVSVRAAGSYAQGDVTVPVVDCRAKMTDVSYDTGALVEYLTLHPTATPYSAVYFNTDSDGVSGYSAMIVTFDGDVYAPLLLEQSGVGYGGAPVFAHRGPSGDPRWIDEPLPQGARGVCYADFDNDRNAANHSDNDFFVCSPTSGGRLYRSRFAQGEVAFDDVTDEVFGASASELAGAFSAAWGDYNEDGFVDLFVSTTSYVGPVKNLGTNPPVTYSVKIFENLGGTDFRKVTYTTPSGSNNLCPSGVWVDLDQDQDLDLVVLNYLSSGGFALVLENYGYNVALGEYQVLAGIWSYPENDGGGMSVDVINYDHDVYPDLLVTEAFGDKRTLILRNNYGTGQNKEFTPIILSQGRDWSGAVVADLDLNGQDDVVLLTKDGMPEMHMGDRGAPGSQPTYRELAVPLGLRRGAASGAFVADFDTDRDLDLYLGRAGSDGFVFNNSLIEAGQQKFSSGPAEQWLRVNLGTVGNSNRTLIGTQVTVTGNGVSQTKVVSGGSGRGGQASNQLVFGLKGVSDPTVSVTVRYPSGEVSSSSSFVNNVVTDVENEPVVIKVGTQDDPEPDFGYDLTPGHSDWVFRWRTGGVPAGTRGVKGDITRDVVHLQNNRNYQDGDPCYVGIEPGQTLDLKWGDPGVSHRVYWDGSYWQHEVRWSGMICATGCLYRFTVSSGLGDGTTTTSGNTKTTPLSYCLPEN